MRAYNVLGTVCAVVLLQACTTTPVQRIDSTPASDENITRWYEQAIPAVENKLDVSLKDVPIKIQDKGEMYYTHHELLEDSVEKAFSKKSRQSILEQQVEDSLDSIIALYDPEKKEIVVDRKNMQDHIDRLKAKGNTTEQAALTVLYHELAHAADDVRYDLTKLHHSNPWKSLERSAVLEGHAQKVTEELCAENDCTQAYQDDEQYLRYLPALTGTAKLFPNRRGDNIALRYVQGANFLRSLEKKENGAELVDQAIKSPPADTLTLFNADRFLDENISKSSAALSAALADNDKQWMSGWVSIPKATFSQSSFPRSTSRRTGFVTTRSSHLLGSAMANYYYPSDKDLLPTSFKLLQAKNAEAADLEAEHMLSEVRHNTGGMLGWSISLRNIKTWEEESESDGASIKTRHFSTELFDPEEAKSKTYRVSIVTFQDYIAEVSSFRSDKIQQRNINAATKMLIKLAIENTCNATCLHANTHAVDSAKI